MYTVVYGIGKNNILTKTFQSKSQSDTKIGRINLFTKLVHKNGHYRPI